MKAFTIMSQCLSMTRIIVGSLVAPILGLLVYFITVSFPIPFSFDVFSSTLTSSLMYFLSIISSSGLFVFPFILVLGTIIMLLLMRSYSCNIAVCVLGAMTNAIMTAALFLVLLLLTGTTFKLALVLFLLLLSVIAVPSILAGILFWFITVFKNAFLINSLKSA